MGKGSSHKCNAATNRTLSISDDGTGEQLDEYGQSWRKSMEVCGDVSQLSTGSLTYDQGWV